MSTFNFFRTRHLCAISLACAFAVPTNAQLLTQKSLSAGLALTIAQTAYDACSKQGYHVSVHVVGRDGETLIGIRGDGASPHTFENSERKAYTARTFNKPSGELVQQLKDNPAFSAIHLDKVIAAQGALPIRAGSDVIGAIGVSGAPGGDKDEACSKAGIDKVAGELS